MELIAVIIILFPIIHVLASDRSHGTSTFAWFVVMLLFSWLGWLVFIIATQSEADRR